MKWDPVIGIDDLGDNLSGMDVNRAYIIHLRDTLNAILHSENNPTVSVKTMIDEVRAAAGNLADVNTRLGMVVDVDGNPITGAGVLSIVNFQTSMGLINHAKNPTMKIWAGGVADDPPTGYIFAGTGASCTRCGVGEGDVNRWIGAKSALLTDIGSGDTYLRQQAFDAGAMATIVNALKAKYCTLTAAVKTNTSDHVRLLIGDGATTTPSDDYHAGDNEWEVMTVTHKISTAATELYYQAQLEKAGDAYVDAYCFTFSQYPPDTFIFPITARGSLFIPIAGLPTVGDDKFSFVFQRPSIFEHAQVRLVTAPGGGEDLDIDIDKYETTGPGWISLFTAAQTIVSGAVPAGGVVPDGDYDHRCFTGGFGAIADLQDAMIRLNIDTVDGATMADARFQLRCLQYLTPLEAFMTYDDL